MNIGGFHKHIPYEIKNKDSTYSFEEISIPTLEKIL
jgi:hypothetical protein